VSTARLVALLLLGGVAVWFIGLFIVYVGRIRRRLGHAQGDRYIRGVLLSGAPLRDAAVAAIVAVPLADPAPGRTVAFHLMPLAVIAWCTGVASQLGSVRWDEHLVAVAHDRGFEVLGRRPWTWRTTHWTPQSASFEVDADTAEAVDALAQAFRRHTSGPRMHLRIVAAGRSSRHRALLAQASWDGRQVVAVWLDVRSEERIRVGRWDSHLPAGAARRERLALTDAPHPHALDAVSGPEGLVLVRPKATAEELGYDELPRLALQVARSQEYLGEPLPAPV